MQEIQETVSVDTDGDMATDATDPVVSDVAETSASEESHTMILADVSVPSASQEVTTYLPVYNGEVCPIRADAQQEITTLLQLGMKQRDFLPQYERLTRLAADHGDASVKALIDRLCDTAEEERRQQAIATYGEEDGNRFYEMERRERSRRYDELIRQQEERRQNTARDTAERLAKEFMDLQTHYPDMTDIRQLPREVIACAVTEGIPLLDAHHRFVVADRQRREQSNARLKAAASHSTGSLSHHGDTPPSAVDAFVSGLYSRR